jgi:hypothetical protein
VKAVFDCRVSQDALPMFEPDEVKVSRPVLRGLGAGNSPRLPGGKPQMFKFTANIRNFCYMEFKAKKIKVDLANPYENDKLSRKADIDNLSLLLRNFSTPIVLSINAPWGQGKTTFLEMLHSDLLNKNCQSLYFSAWETDFAVDPLLAFLGEMNFELDTLINGNQVKNEAWNKAKKAGSHILKKGIPALIKLGTAGVLDIIEFLTTSKSPIVFYSLYNQQN